jgi:hypothetical protein
MYPLNSIDNNCKAELVQVECQAELVEADCQAGREIKE